jgi:hypothetical protein
MPPLPFGAGTHSPELSQVSDPQSAFVAQFFRHTPAKHRLATAQSVSATQAVNPTH